MRKSAISLHPTSKQFAEALIKAAGKARRSAATGLAPDPEAARELANRLERYAKAALACRNERDLTKLAEMSVLGKHRSSQIA
jgi:uncharacterized membrane protein